MKKHYFTVILVLICLVCFFGCTPNFSMVMNDDDTTNISFICNPSEVLETSLTSIISSPDSSIYDLPSIEASLKENDLQNIQLKTTSPMNLQFSGKILNFSDNQNILSDFITVKTENGKTQLLFDFNPQKLGALISIIPGASDYIEFLMAPIFTGEECTDQEYLETIGIVYGNTIANEFQKATLKISITTPQKIVNTSASNVDIGSINFSGKTATIQLKLYKFLSYQKNSSYCIQY